MTPQPFSDKRESWPVPSALGGLVGTIWSYGTQRPEGDRRAYGTADHAYVSVVEFGDVTATDSLAFCVYDESGSGGATELVLQALVGPGGECLREGATDPVGS